MRKIRDSTRIRAQVQKSKNTKKGQFQKTRSCDPRPGTRRREGSRPTLAGNAKRTHQDSNTADTTANIDDYDMTAACAHGWRCLRVRAASAPMGNAAAHARKNSAANHAKTGTKNPPLKEGPGGQSSTLSGAHSPVPPGPGGQSPTLSGAHSPARCRNVLRTWTGHPPLS